MVSQEEPSSSKIDEKDYTLTNLYQWRQSYPQQFLVLINNLDGLSVSDIFQVVKEYGVLAYLHEGGQYYPTWTNGEDISTRLRRFFKPEPIIDRVFR